MSLPERSYYPLPEAAKKLGCSMRDVIHYGATGVLDLYVFINHLSAPENAWFHLNVPSDKASKIDCFNCLSGDGWIIHDVFYKKELDGFLLDGFYAKSISGFFSINEYVIQPLEFSESVNLETIFLSSHPETENYLPVDINFIGFSLSLSRDFLCVHSDSIRKIESSKAPSHTIAKNQASLIKALLYIHYGEDVANKPRAFFENKDSEIAVDFQLKGIDIPSGKTVAGWIKDVDIDFLP